MGYSVGRFRRTPELVRRVMGLLLLIAICVSSTATSWGRVSITLPVQLAVLPPEQSSRSTWIAISSIFVSCVSIFTLQSKLAHRRKMILEEQMATSLAIALRRGDLDFNIPVSGSTVNIFAFWRGFEELDDSEMQLIPSRYRLLGHSIRLLPGPTPAPEERPTVRVRLIGSAEPQKRNDFQDDLFLGVPKVLLAPQLRDELPEAAG